MHRDGSPLISTALQAAERARVEGNRASLSSEARRPPAELCEPVSQPPTHTGCPKKMYTPIVQQNQKIDFWFYWILFMQLEFYAVDF